MMKALWKPFLTARYPLAVVLSLLVVFTACEDEENNPVNPEPEANALELANDNDELSNLVDAINRTDLADALSDDNNPVTIFAPNNSAFADYIANNDNFSSLGEIPEDVLTDVLSYHVVASKTLAANLSEGDVATLLSGESIGVTRDNGVILNGNIRVISADNEVSNGVVHIIDGVLDPNARQEADQSIVEIVTEGEDFSILETALTKFPDVVETLQGDGPFTVFGPSNGAFAKFLEEDDRFAELDDIPDDVLKAVLQYHVLAGEKLADDLGESEETVQGESITIAKNDDGVTLNGDIMVSSADVMATNGVIHVIDNVLLPPSLDPQPTIAELAVATDDLSILVAALQRAPDLLEAAANAESTLTVFAPTNAAFEQLLADSEEFTTLNDIPDDVLTTILQYHILGSIKQAADLTESEETLNGESIMVTTTEGEEPLDISVVLNGEVNVATADIMASNGVVHLIDQVLMPPSLLPQPTIAEIATSTDNLSILVAALQRAPDLLAAAGNAEAMLTVFAPSNEAFAKLLEEDPRFSSLDDIPDEVLTQILQYHILGATKLAEDLVETEETLSGESLSIDKSDGVVINGNVTVTTADVMAANGVVHLIDRVLVPESLAPPATIAQIASNTEALSTLVAALQRTPDLLETAGDFNADITVFAPTNDAFTDLLATLSEALGVQLSGLDDVPDYVLRRVLEYHILNSGKLAAELEGKEETLEGSNLDINKNGGVVINETTNVIADLANIEAANGVVHVIDEVLVPRFILRSIGTMLQPAVFDAEGRFTTFLAAVEAAGVTVIAEPTANWTLFLPTNEAFEQLIAEDNGFNSAEELLAAENLEDILLYHLSGIRRASTDFAQGASATHSRLKINDKFIEISISNNGANGIFINGEIQVIEADIDTDNGVVHIVDGVLIPSTQTVTEIAVAATQGDAPQFTQLVAALAKVEEASVGNPDLLPLVSILDEERGDELSPFTVFAPTDAAFAELYQALDVNGVDEIDAATLQAVLLLHVSSGEDFYSTDLTNGALEMIGGEITINADNLTIADGSEDSADASIVGANILATNGVIHVIDQVLLP
ncbi:fasciclin domain-containing protein [Tunicatimonas pelagia]|uniref:fasciclin domain-containing protein n=1 Tax=Tunicatimonas pelagia TaxID=931531 RepID=UPI002666B836|nr:fasciclin domain-containing protein [Tunicatimonas pelagia]WKN41639.1 fasciclin domain-containing protein [Tunicatimonas pelagia]